MKTNGTEWGVDLDIFSPELGLDKRNYLKFSLLRDVVVLFSELISESLDIYT